MASIHGDRVKGYRVHWREAGEQRASTTFRSKLDAADFLRDLEERLGAEKQLRMPAMGSTPLADLFKKHRASRLGRRRARDAYLNEKWAHIDGMAKEQGWETIRDITGASVDEWLSKREGGKGTDKPLAALKSFLRWCRRLHGLPVDQRVLDLERQRLGKRAAPDLLTPAQVEAILAEAQKYGPSVLAALEHLAFYGCRPIDVCRARVKDWNPTTRTLTFRSTKNSDDLQTVVLEHHARRLSALAKGRDPEAPLFLDPWGREWRMDREDEATGQRIPLGKAEGITSWYKTNVGEVLGPARKPTKARPGGTVLAANQRGIYQLKKYAITRAYIAAGGNKRAVVALSGHRTMSVVDRYIQSNREVQEALLRALSATASGPSASPDVRPTPATPGLPAPDESLLSSVTLRRH